MTSLLTPISPTMPQPTRDAAGLPPTGVMRASPPPSAALSARAPQPPDPTQKVPVARNQTSGERPVGPPPSFEINVLQDIRSQLVAPPEMPEHSETAEPPDDAEDNGRTFSPVDAGAAQADDAGQATPLTGPAPEPPHALDMKV